MNIELQLKDQEFPFPHLSGNFFLPNTTLNDLYDVCYSLPFQSIQRCQGGEKTYCYSIYPLLLRGCLKVGPTTILGQLAKSLGGESMKAKLGSIVGRCLSDTVTDVTIFRFSQGNWLGPHLDHPAKILSLCLYLTPHWEDNWGGGLQLLVTGPRGKACRTILPSQSNAMLLIRSDDSWHEVAPVSAKAHYPRLSLTLEVWASEDEAPSRVN